MSLACFIVGVGRSGTSLLQAMLASHSQVTALPETSFLRRFVCAKGYNSPLEDDHVNRSDLLVNSLKLELLPKNSGDNVVLFDAYKKMLEKCRSRYVLDKDPRLVESIGFVKTLLPSSKVLYIYRDPRDVLVSKKKAKWSSGRSLFAYLVASVVQTKYGCSLIGKGLAKGVKYEDLVSSPEEVLSNICLFLDMPYEEALMNYQGAARALVQASEISWKKETFSSIKSDNFNKWQSELSDLEALSSYLVLYNIHKRRGYTLDMRAYSVRCCALSLILSFFVVVSSKLYLISSWLKMKKIEKKFKNGN